MIDKKILFHEALRQKYIPDTLTNWDLIDLASPIGVVRNSLGQYIAYPYDDTNPAMTFAGVLSNKNIKNNTLDILSLNTVEVASIKDGFVYGITLPDGAEVGDYIKPVKDKFIVTTSGDGIATIITTLEDNYYIALGRKQGGGGSYTLPVATAAVLGGVRVPAGGKLKIDTDGNLSVDAGAEYVLPTASADVLGGVKVGDNLTIETDGRLNATPAPDVYGDDNEILTGKTYYQGPVNPAKPIYRKCYSNIGDTGGEGIDISDLNIAVIVEQSFLFSVGNGIYKTFYMRSGALPSLWGAVNFDTTLGTRLLIFNPDSLNYRCNVILEYIKR